MQKNRIKFVSFASLHLPFPSAQKEITAPGEGTQSPGVPGLSRHLRDTEDVIRDMLVQGNQDIILWESGYNTLVTNVGPEYIYFFF